MQWSKHGNIVKPLRGGTEIDKLDSNSVYFLSEDQFGFFLEEKPELQFPNKIYGLETKFIERALKYFNKTDKNLGVLLYGSQGTGKTVTAKTLAQRSKLPIIFVNHRHDDIASFIASFTQSCCFIFDEFEKIYSEKNEESREFLSLLDGVANSPYKHMYILTTNSLRVNEYLLNRPARIRYVRKFRSLQETVIREILEDRLEDQNKTEDVISVAIKADELTIDILTSFIDECNIHDEESVTDLFDSFNITCSPVSYSLYCQPISNGTLTENRVLIESSVKTTPYSITRSNNVYTEEGYIEVVKPLEQGMAFVSSTDPNSFIESKNYDRAKGTPKLKPYFNGKFDGYYYTLVENTMSHAYRFIDSGYDNM